MTHTDTTYDAVVVGAGPAGSSAAAAVARAGFQVLLLEEHAQIGIPLHCSGLVTQRTLDEASVGEEIVLNRVVGAHIFAPSGRQLTLGDGTTRALVIDRVGLDRALVDKAQEQGVHLMTNAKVVAVERNGSWATMTVERNGANINVSARLVIGADGANSRVARTLGMEGYVEHVVGLGAEGTLRGADSEHVQVFVGKSIAPGWFAWTIPLGGDSVRLGVGTSNDMKPADCLEHLFQTHADHLAGWKPTRWTGGTIPIWSRRRIVQSGVMLVGDAAGQVKPTSGGGIYPSLVSARLAADVACDALTNDDLSARALGAYPRAWQKIFGREFRRGEDLRRVYTSLDDRDFDRLLRIFGNKRLLRIVNKYGDIDFPGGLFQRLTRLAPALWFFVRGPLHHAPLWGKVRS